MSGMGGCVGMLLESGVLMGVLLLVGKGMELGEEGLLWGDEVWG